MSEQEQEQKKLVVIDRRNDPVIPVSAAQPDNSPGALLRLALERDLDIAKVEKLLELQERYEATAARKAYVAAMSEFKAGDCPTIVKDRRVSFRTQKGGTEYAHASLAQIVDKCVAALARHGFHHEWSAAQDARGIAVTCRLTHRQGHSETTTLTAGHDTSGTKNAIQAMASTVTYLERYTLLMALGLAPADDDDGRASGPPVAEAEPRTPAPRRPPPLTPRARRAIDVWARYLGATTAQAAMESFLGRAAGAWDDGDFDALLAVWARARSQASDADKAKVLQATLAAGRE